MKICSVVTYLWLILWILNQLKGYNSCTTEASPTNLNVHQHTIVIYTYFKFHKILFISYLVMAYSMDFKSIQGL